MRPRGCGCWSGWAAGHLETRRPRPWSWRGPGPCSPNSAPHPISPGWGTGPPGGHLKAHGLTERELQVLRLVATGTTNHAIASQLFVAEKTVDRHVSNIFTKLGLSSRAAATAYAYQHRLL